MEGSKNSDIWGKRQIASLKIVKALNKVFFTFYNLCLGADLIPGQSSTHLDSLFLGTIQRNRCHRSMRLYCLTSLGKLNQTREARVNEKTNNLLQGTKKRRLFASSSELLWAKLRSSKPSKCSQAKLGWVHLVRDFIINCSIKTWMASGYWRWSFTEGGGDRPEWDRDDEEEWCVCVCVCVCVRVGVRERERERERERVKGNISQKPERRFRPYQNKKWIWSVAAAAAAIKWKHMLRWDQCTEKFDFHFLVAAPWVMLWMT